MAAKKSNVIPFKQRPLSPKKVFKDRIAARMDSTSVCGCGQVIKASTTCGQCP
ncbi:hypothetical protein ACFWYW_19765 [Nonomuraea sp. NPDC059023]|uniref:hypothetical protein n=1 Tax=unclassified Nonomuraea TaxID=2593643 RepID=UPI003681E2D1